MSNRPLAVAMVTALLVVAGATAADQEIHPDWMKADPAGKTVWLRMVGAADGSNGTMNFNGYGKGEMTVTVPPGWRVKIDFENKGLAALPHSLVIINEITPLPIEDGTAAFPRALTIRLVEGLLAGEKDSLEFVANKEGRFLFFCGVTGHGVAGMWDYLVVSKDATAPTVRVVARPGPARKEREN
jgi:sulfocyanin